MTVIIIIIIIKIIIVIIKYNNNNNNNNNKITYIALIRYTVVLSVLQSIDKFKISEISILTSLIYIVIAAVKLYYNMNNKQLFEN